MVSVVWALVAASSGLLAYLLVGFLGYMLPIGARYKIGKTYLKMSARCFKQFTFIRRILSGYDILPIGVDAEQKLLKVTLDSSLIGSDKKHRFVDPDNRIKRLWNKPVAISMENVPAAIDAELSEWGYWVREKRANKGLWSGDLEEDYDNVTVDPYVEMDSSMRLVDPIDAFELVGNSVDPENIRTAEQLTKKRYEKYGSKVGMAETVGVIMGFAVGIGAIAGVQYLKQSILDGAGGTGPSAPISLPPGIIAQIDLSWLVMFL